MYPFIAIRDPDLTDGPVSRRIPGLSLKSEGSNEFEKFEVVIDESNANNSILVYIQTSNDDFVMFSENVIAILTSNQLVKITVSEKVYLINKTLNLKRERDTYPSFFPQVRE